MPKAVQSPSRTARSGVRPPLSISRMRSGYRARPRAGPGRTGPLRAHGRGRAGRPADARARDGRRGHRGARRGDRRGARRWRDGGQRADQRVPAAARGDGAGVAAAGAGGRRAPGDPRGRRRRRSRGRAGRRAAGRRRDPASSPRCRPRRRAPAGAAVASRSTSRGSPASHRRSRRTYRRRPARLLADRTCMLHEGTSVVAGHGRAVVVAVGAATAAGRATRRGGGGRAPGGRAGAAGRADPCRAAPDPGRRRGRRRAVALRGAARCARPSRRASPSRSPRSRRGCRWSRPSRSRPPRAGCRAAGAVVRNARVLEALGRIDTVCFDKTGTLTENRLRVVRLVPLDAGALPDDLLALAAVAGDPAADAHVHEVDRAIAPPPRSSTRPAATGSLPAVHRRPWLLRRPARGSPGREGRARGRARPVCRRRRTPGRGWSGWPPGGCG